MFVLALMNGVVIAFAVALAVVFIVLFAVIALLHLTAGVLEVVIWGLRQ